MNTPRRPRLLLAIVLGVALLAGVLALTRPAPATPLRLVVLSDSLSEGMGQVTGLEKTWPHLVGARVRAERGESARDGGTWLPASVNGEMFGFRIGTAGAGAWAATAKVGIPGAIAGASVTWQTDGYDSAVVQVVAERAGQSFSASTGERRIDLTSPDAGPHSFTVDSLDDTLTVQGDGVVVGVLARAGSGSVDVYNLSWSGSSTNDWLGWLDRPALLPLIQAIQPDVIVLSLGGNDFWQSGDPDRFGAHLRRMHDQVAAVAPSASWVLGTQPVPDQTSAQDWTRFQQVTLDYAAELGAPTIDLAQQMPGASAAPQLYSWDRTHLTDAGHAFIAGLAEPAIDKAIR
ncbi:MAG: SGNH/GDSL hydrolase family protein [Micropruina sp.]|uniref:SGNH/GDSL hydrolase family protein n=1 Tax=Micropruina sp. TaxID=2737536 RepID=UPI0039E697A9